MLRRLFINTIRRRLRGCWVALRLKSTSEPKFGYLSTQRIGEAVFMRLDEPNHDGTMLTPYVFPQDDVREIVLSDFDKMMAAKREINLSDFEKAWMAREGR